MRSSVAVCVLALALATPAAAQEQTPQERLALGADSLFGPGIVDLSPNGSAAKLRLARAGDQWIDLPWAVTLGRAAGTVTFTVARVELVDVPLGARMPAAALPAAPPAAVPPAGAASGGTVTLVIVSDSAWSRDAIAALLPQEPQGSPMALAHAIAAALLGGRSDTCAAYLVRW